MFRHSWEVICSRLTIFIGISELAIWISTGLLCQFVVFNLSVNGYVFESVSGYDFERDKQLAFMYKIIKGVKFFLML